MNCLTHACLVVMLPWMEGNGEEGSSGQGSPFGFMCLLEMKGLIVSALIDHWLVVTQVGMQTNERVGSEGLCKQSDTHTHTYTQITNYTKISLVGVCVHVCIQEKSRQGDVLSSKCNKTELKVAVNNPVFLNV